MNLNKVTIAGNLTRDPELRATPKGMSVTNIGVAVNSRYKTREGEQKEDTTFLNVTFFGGTADTVAQHFKKGQPIYVEGRMKNESWEKEGKTFSKLVIIGDTFQFVGSKADSASASSPAAPPARQSRPAAPASQPAGGEDDVPF